VSTGSACAARCGLDRCLGEGCWLERAALAPAVDALLATLRDAALRHAARCGARACRHVAHGASPAEAAEEPAA
jgi:hypothetical protein